jgi:hypothetical protein
VCARALVCVNAVGMQRRVLILSLLHVSDEMFSIVGNYWAITVNIFQMDVFVS